MKYSTTLSGPISKKGENVLKADTFKCLSNSEDACQTTIDDAKLFDETS